VSDDITNVQEPAGPTAAREAAEVRYNRALAAVDRSVPKLDPVVLPRIGDDELAAARAERLDALRRSAGGSVIRRVLGGAKITLQQGLGRLARSVRKLARLGAADAASVDAAMVQINRHLQELAQFHHNVVQYMQGVFPLVDAERQYQSVIVSALSAFVEEVNGVNALRWETLSARERRFTAALDEVRTSVANVQQTGATLKRELERMLAARSAAAAAPASQPAATGAVPLPQVPAAPAWTEAPDAVNAYRYVGFEDRFRGSQSDILERQATYLPLFEGASDVLDLGCGRGEFLAALGARGVGARGLDINHEMVEVCRSAGLRVDEGDALAWLERQADGSLGGLFAAQVVEHFVPGYLTRLLDVAYLKLRPGSRLVLETVNPACWSAFFDSYIRDVTHAWPLHPETLSYLVTAAGFQRVDVKFLSPYPPDDRMQRVTIADERMLSPAEALLVETFNANVDRLNDQLFSHRDYAIVADRL